MDELTRQVNEVLEHYAPSGRATLIAYGRDGLLQMTRIPNPDFVQPPVRFSERLGLAGVHKNYNLPEGLSAERLESYVLVLEHAETKGDMSPRERKDRVAQMWQGIVARNPDLNAVTLNNDSADDIQTVLRGVASAYVPRDIDHFMRLPPDKLAHACKDKAYADVYKHIADYLGEAPRWVPAMETMRHIEQQAASAKLRAFHSQRYDFD